MSQIEGWDLRKCRTVPDLATLEIFAPRFGLKWEEEIRDGDDYM
jgi:hypothetical protein